ncbi:alpha/beta hydrolase family protein [Planctomycetota bacterium]
MHVRWPFWVFLSAMLLPGVMGEALPEAAEGSRAVRVLQTEGGVRFGIWGEKSDEPGPTLFVLASTIEETLGDTYYRQSGSALAEWGYLSVSVDLPCHGLQQRPDEPGGLGGWRARSERNEDFVAESNARLREVLDHLIRAGYTDAERVAACGTSRGGFLALHFAASDSRVKCVAAFAPVTELGALREFEGATEHPLVGKLALANQAEKLAGRAVWLVIGDQDERVGTDHTISLARRITAASLASRVPSRVELHVMPEPRGHTTPSGAAQRAAEWIRRQIESPTPESQNAPDRKASQLQDSVYFVHTTRSL